jgi:hypothetical protein
VRKAIIERYDGPINLYNTYKSSFWPNSAFTEITAKSVVELITSIAAGNDSIETKFATILKDDLKIAVENDNISYMNKILVPLLHMEETIPVTLSGFDPITKSYCPIF